METQNEKDDVIGRLMREEGLLSPSPGFTDRVMMLVEASRQRADAGYKPLISRKTWIIIGLFISILLMICIYVNSSGNTGQSAYLSKIKTTTDFLTTIHVPLHVDTNALMLATLIIATVGLLLLFDFLLNNRFREVLK